MIRVNLGERFLQKDVFTVLKLGAISEITGVLYGGTYRPVWWF